MEVGNLDGGNAAYLLHRLKQIFTHKRMKASLYIVAVLWLAVITQLVVNRLFHEDLRITEAFIKANTDDMESGIEVIAEYKNEILSEQDKKDILNRLATAIGLQLDQEISIIKDGNRSEYSYTKEAKNANSELKFISLEQNENEATIMKHYIVMRINIYHKVKSIDKLKNTIEKTLTQIGVAQKQITLYYSGIFEGELSKKEKSQIASELIGELQGKSALEYAEDGIYTVYAYTGLINEYVVSAGTKVNIQIAFNYNENTKKTKVYLATPLLNVNW